MDPKITARLEELLTYPQDISQTEVNRRIKEIEEIMKLLFPLVPEFSTAEKAVFIKLLSRSNDLCRRAMENEMNQLNLNPEKLQKIFHAAQHSKSPEAVGLLNALAFMKTQADLLQQSLARVNVVMSKNGDEKKKEQSPEQQRLKRSKWQKP
jgi:hypothetical protein